MHWAVYVEDVELVDALLKAGANAKVANDLGVSPLMMACQNGNGTITERLLAKLASLKVYDLSKFDANELGKVIGAYVSEYAQAEKVLEVYGKHAK